MTMLDKALKLARDLAAKRTAATDPSTVIRAALGAAGLLGKTQPPAGPDVLGCFAPSGLTAGLDKLLPTLRARAPKPQAADVKADTGTFVWCSITGAWGTRRYRLFTPDRPTPPRGLIVMLHGCSQNPDDFAAGTRMNSLGQEHNLLVAYPEQTRSANPSGCWNWFSPADQVRGKGEPALIAAITGTLAAANDLPPDRCFVAGLSAGGAMAAIMAETYPDLYGAAAIHSGLPFGAANDMTSAFSAMRGHGLAVGRPAQPGLPVIVMHGDADRTVHPANADAIHARLVASAGKDLRETVEDAAEPGGRACRRVVGRSADGIVRFEDWRLAGAGHAWSGGSAAGSFTEPAGVDASRAMVRFFLEHASQPPLGIAAAGALS